MSLPLSDIKIVDITQVFAGPFATMLLADQGAEVIKIEPPEGDSSRRLVPNFPGSNGLSSGFLSFNRNKRSVVLDLSKPKGRALAHRLLLDADVLVIATRVGARKRHSLSYEDVAKINPNLIYASLTGFGEEGPDADQPGLDVIAQARSGDLAGRRMPGGPMPIQTNLNHFDMAAAMLIAYAVMLALRQRERTGRGQKIEVNLLQSALACQAPQMTRVGESDNGYSIQASMDSTYLCGDGRYILAAAAAGTRWAAICGLLGLDHLADDPDYNTLEKRHQKADELHELFSRQFATKSAAEWEAILKFKGLPASVIKDMSEVYDDEQVIANKMITQFEQPGLGTVKAINVPFKILDTADEQWLRRHAPTLGENTLEVLQELGQSQDEIDALKAEGVIG